MSSHVFYHANCMDGFASACVVAAYLRGEGTYTPVQYSDEEQLSELLNWLESDEATDADVYVVDFAWGVIPMQEIVRRCRSLTWIDHHKTSAWILDELLATAGADRRLVHSQDFCGALLCWIELMDRDYSPTVLTYVNDRDLWLWDLPDSKEVSAALRTLWWYRMDRPQDHFEEFLGQVEDVTLMLDEAGLGAHILANQDKDVESAVRQAERCQIDDFRALAVNSPANQSEIGHRLLQEEGCEVAIIYFRKKGRWIYSLRSEGDVDVSEIAKERGGGGHKHAAGFEAEFLYLPSLPL